MEEKLFFFFFYYEDFARNPVGFNFWVLLARALKVARQDVGQRVGVRTSNPGNPGRINSSAELILIEIGLQGETPVWTTS